MSDDLLERGVAKGRAKKDNEARWERENPITAESVRDNIFERLRVHGERSRKFGAHKLNHDVVLISNGHARTKRNFLGFEVKNTEFRMVMRIVVNPYHGELSNIYLHRAEPDGERDQHYREIIDERAHNHEGQLSAIECRADNPDGKLIRETIARRTADAFLSKFAAKYPELFEE
jgi:hypothetical protein